MANVKVKMLVSLSGVDFAVHAGDEHTCDQDEAARLVEAGYAEPVAARRSETRESKTPTATRADRRKRS